MNRWLVLSLAILCIIIIAVIVFSENSNQSPNTPNISDSPDRIVSMAPNLTEILFALGLEEKIVGVTTYSDYPPAAAEKPKMGTFWQPNIEAVVAAEPDMVITLTFQQQKNLAKRLKRINCDVLTVGIEKVSELFSAIESIGTATKTKIKADALVLDIKNKINDFSAKLPAGDKIRVLWVIQKEPLRVAGTDTFVNELITLAGGRNAIGNTIHQYPPIGTEELYSCAPDVIIEPAEEEQPLHIQQENALKYWSKFKNVPAVKKERIYVIDPGPVSRLGPRMPDAVRSIAECLRPELFKKND
ncbi:MAG TPA: ABC transporter substrate-binding protein [Planctomycetes bacterium]|nr:ABC transporter substrate-binding protein [Planctomycetota bacterium]